MRYMELFLGLLKQDMPCVFVFLRPQLLLVSNGIKIYILYASLFLELLNITQFSEKRIKSNDLESNTSNCYTTELILKKLTKLNTDTKDHCVELALLPPILLTNSQSLHGKVSRLAERTLL